MFHIEFSTLIIILLLFVVAIVVFANINRKKANMKLVKLNKKLVERDEKYKLVVEVVLILCSFKKRETLVCK